MDYVQVLDTIAQVAQTTTSPEPFEDSLAILPLLQDVDKYKEREYARRFRELASDAVMRCCEQRLFDDADRIMACIESILKLNARDDFDSYMLFMEWNRPPEKRFYQPRRGVLFPWVVSHLQDLADDKLDFLSISMPPRTGKALAFDTPVLTRSGWKQHGDLTIRDEVLAPNGSFVHVTAIHPICDMEYEIEFTNGEKVVCHGEHEWRVHDRHGEKVRDISVSDMLKSNLEEGAEQGRGHRYRYMLANRESMIGEEKELPVGPYTLGAWLGDGRNQNPDICGAETDYPIVQAILDEGYTLAWDTKHKTTGVRYYGFKKLRQDLQSVGMCHSRCRVPKHIPDVYFVASIEQRLQLLAGLLDTDGTLRKKEHRYAFTTSEPSLRDDFIKLVSTFGWRCSVVEYPPRQHGSIKGSLPYWVVAFNPTLQIPCRLERKQLNEFSEQLRIAVKSIKKHEGAKGNCITVEGGMYCVGKTLVPTHNSTTCIFYLTWTMGKYPYRANVMSGHSDKLTNGFYKEAMSIITDPTYRFLEVFPDSTMRDNSAKGEQIWLKGSHERFPTLTCRSIEGTLTGAVEVGKRALLYMDDLVEDREEALNVDRMDKLYSAYLNQLKDRMNDGAKQLFVATRWVPNDPIGRIEEQYADNPRYRFVAVPALDEDGHSNFEYMYGLGFSTEYYEDMRQSLIDAGEEDSWMAKYMGRPYWMSGLMFPEDELKRYSELPEGEPDAIIAACDTKDRGIDYACMPIGYVYGDRHYIHQVICDNSLPEVVEPRLRNALVDNSVSLARFESNSAGGRVADDIEKQCHERGLSIKIQKKFSTENKETRILADSLWIKEHCYFRAEAPDGDYKRFINMLTHYTVSGKNKHDDAPDSMSMYKRFACSMRKATVQAIRRPY